MTQAPSLLSIVTAIACAASACSSSTRTSGTVAAVGGTAVAIAGGAMLIALSSDDDREQDLSDKEVACVLGGCYVAALLAVTGLVTASIGFVALSRDEAAPPAPPLPPPPPASGPPGETAEVDVRLVAPLPEMPCDAMTLQFAKQARAAARRGDCDIARMITRRIAERDPRYADALSISPALARCPPR